MYYVQYVENEHACTYTLLHSILVHASGIVTCSAQLPQLQKNKTKKTT